MSTSSVGGPVRGPDDLARAFDRHASEVLSFCRRRCSDPFLAEDLVSVVFMEAWRCRDRATLVDGTLRPWLYGIALNVLRNSDRSTRRHRAALDRFHAQHPVDEADHAEAVARAVDQPRERAALDAAFSRLSRRDRDVADLVLLAELPINQAASALDLPVGTVKSRLAHARAHLQRLLRPEDLGSLSDPAATSGHERDERSLRAPTGTVTR